MFRLSSLLKHFILSAKPVESKPVEIPLKEVNALLGVDVVTPSKDDGKGLIGTFEVPGSRPASVLTIITFEDGGFAFRYRNEDASRSLVEMAGLVKGDKAIFDLVTLREKRSAFNEETIRKLMNMISIVNTAEPKLDAKNIRDFTL